MTTLDLKKILFATNCYSNNNPDSVPSDIDAVIAWQAKLQQINVDNVDPMFSSLEQNLCTRSGDQVCHFEGNISSNAPDFANRYFLVPKVIKK
jgi:aspartyl/glutamyl-tRNA(Asn/Gln) amidotransferase C subunit